MSFSSSWFSVDGHVTDSSVSEGRRTVLKGPNDRNVGNATAIVSMYGPVARLGWGVNLPGGHRVVSLQGTYHEP